MSSVMYIFEFITIYVINVDFIKIAIFRILHKWYQFNQQVTKKHVPYYCISKITKLAPIKNDFEVDNVIRNHFQCCISKFTAKIAKTAKIATLWSPSWI